MEKKDKVVCSVLGFLGLLCATLCFAAEATRTTASKIVYTPTTCIFPSTPAIGLGIAAGVTLVVAQIIINVTTACVCCKRGSYQVNSKRTTAVICFIASWITLVTVIFLLIIGATDNEPGEVANFDCTPVYGKGVFAVAALLSIGSVGLGIVSYLALESGKIRLGSIVGTAAAPNQSNIAMGKPQFPAPHIPLSDPETPVFVHEDTYMRRQFP